MSSKSYFKNGILTTYDPAKKNIWTNRLSRYRFNDDFERYTTIPDDGSRANGSPWVQDITGAAPPVVSLVADGSAGIVSCALTADSQAQDATIHWDDNRHIDLDKGVVFQALWRATVLPTSTVTASVGLGGDHAATGFAGLTYALGFSLAASGALSAYMDDNVGVVTASAATVTVNTWYVLRVEVFQKTAIRFYVDGVQVASGFSYGASAGANSTLQPFIGVCKASGTGVGTIQVDSVDIWQD